MSIKGEIAKQAFRETIAAIKFFHDKPPDFLWHFLPNLKQMNFYSGDFLYHQWEHAEDLFFIRKGKVKLMYDLMEGLGQPYMIPFNMYAAGSYFGDSDLLADKEMEGRDGTALVDLESMVLVMTRADLN